MNTTSTESGTLKIIEDACTFSADKSAGKIVIESTLEPFNMAITELGGSEPKKMALGYAVSNGVDGASLNGLVGSAYPVNKKGLNIYRVTGPNGAALPANHPDKQPAAYRITVPVARKV